MKGADKGLGLGLIALLPSSAIASLGALASGDTQEAETKTNELLEALHRFAKTR